MTVITGDGADGYLPGAPYDRTIATAGVTTVLYTWIAQTTPGGRIVLPMLGVYQPPGLLSLIVHGDGPLPDVSAVRQGGQRKLWDEVHAAYQGWLAAGSPAAEAWLVTVEPTGQRVELAP